MARRIRYLDDDAIRAMLEQEDESDEEIGGEENDDEERVVYESDHSTDSEIDGDQLQNSDRSNHSESSDKDDENYYLCKDKVTKWYKNPCVSKFAKTPSQNLLKFLLGPRNNASHIEDEVQAFLLLITDEMIEEIVGCTNMYITAVRSNYDRKRDAKILTKTELMAFLGLLVLSGVKRAEHVSFLELWATDGSGIEIFRACMSYNRFLLLLLAIRFDDKTTWSQRKETDKLAAIQYILDEFVQNCKNTYCLTEFLTIDETLVLFRGRCSFIQYIPSKPAKYGVKIFALCDAKIYFTGNLEVYCGKQPTGPHEVSNSPADIVERLISHLKGTCRNLTTNNWYTSYTLAMSLLQDKITPVRTLKKNKREIPAEFLPNKQKPISSSMFGFQKHATLVSFTPKKNKSVVLLSTMHRDAKVDAETKKPEIIQFYNSTKGGVDTVDQLCGNYSVSRKTRRWPLCVFFHLVNIAGVNGQILFNKTRKSVDEAQNRRQFLKNLAMSLMKPHLQDRAQLQNFPSDIQSILSKYKPQSQVDTHEPPPAKSQKRCRLCGRAKNRVTTMRCFWCNDFVCKDHAKTDVKCDTCAHLASNELS